MPRSHHTVDYLELPAPDLAAAKTFYAAAFGWQFTDYGPGYSGFRAAGAQDESGGFDGEAGTGARPLVLLYSDDLDATLAAVVEAGGTVTKDPYDFPGGRRFYFTDPAGSELGVWQSTE